MADFKRQHYVPKCYFKPFSVEKTGAAINLVNISRYKHVRNAPIKGQFARDYFYGEELVLEKWLQQHEGDYAGVIRKLQGGSNLDENDLLILRSFAYLQHSRTETAIRR